MREDSKKHPLHQMMNDSSCLTKRFVRHGGGHGNPDGLFHAYTSARPMIMKNILATKFSLEEIEESVSQLRLTGAFPEKLFDNFLLSCSIAKSTHSTAEKKRLYALIDKHIKPRIRQRDWDNFVAAYLFARLMQYGASFNKCSEIFAKLWQGDKADATANRTIETRSRGIRSYLESSPDQATLMILDFHAIFILPQGGFSFSKYIQENYTKAKPEAAKAIDEHFLFPLFNYLSDVDGVRECWDYDEPLTWSESNHIVEKADLCDMRLGQALFQAFTFLRIPFPPTVDIENSNV